MAINVLDGNEVPTSEGSLSVSFGGFGAVFDGEVTIPVNNVEGAIDRAFSDMGASLVGAVVNTSTARNLRSELTFESGVFRKNSSAPDPDGVYRDGVAFFTSDKEGIATRTITNITKASPAIASYTGATLSNGDRLTMGVISGMTELSEKLIVVRNPTGSTFQCYRDGDFTGYNNPTTVYPTVPNDLEVINSNSYGTFSGNTTGQEWLKFPTGGDGTHGHVNSGDKMTIINTPFTPPSNDNGAAEEVTALIGSRMFQTQINYWHYYDSNSKNKPRGHIKMSNVQSMADGETMWMSTSVFLPSNFHQETINTGDISRTTTMTMDANNSGSNNAFWLTGIIRFSGNSNMSWVIDIATGGTSRSMTSDILLDSIVDDIGVWTTFVFKIKNHPTNGIAKIWKSKGPSRAMTLVYNRVNSPVGYINPDGWWFAPCRSYKFSWHHSPNTINSTVQWIGWDQCRTGTEENNGTTYSDVHPFRESEP